MARIEQTLLMCNLKSAGVKSLNKFNYEKMLLRKIKAVIRVYNSKTEPCWQHEKCQGKPREGQPADGVNASEAGEKTTL